MPRRQPRQAKRQPEREQRPKEREANGIEMPNIEEEPLQPWLVPIGNTGFYQSPVEPVDPRDCDRWPDSPYCGGSGVNTDDFIDLAPHFHRNGCEICVTISPTLSYISLPPYTVCYRTDSPECRPQPQTQPIPPADIVQGATFDVSQQCPCHVYEVSWNIHLDGTSFRVSGNYLSPVYGLFIKNGFHQSGYQEEMQPDYIDTIFGIRAVCVQAKYPLFEGVTTAFCADPRTFIATENFGGLIGISGVQIRYNRVKDREFYLRQGTWTPCELNPGGALQVVPGASAPPYPNQSEEPCCMNCAEQDRLLRLIAKRVGTDDYPASVPKSLLTGRERGQEKIESLTQLIGWFVQQVDALVGEFPVELTIEDIDPTKPGKQSKKVAVPNIAEAIAELYGLALKNTVDSDIHTNFMMRLAAEIIATKNAAIVTQDYARANATFLGYKANPKKRKVNYAFDPEGLESLETILKESEKYVQGWQEDDPETVVGFLQRIVFSAGIIKAAFLRNKDQLGNLKGDIDNLLKKSEGDQDELWRQFLRAVENPDHRFNQGNVPTPEIKDLSQTSNEGLSNLLGDQT